MSYPDMLHTVVPNRGRSDIAAGGEAREQSKRDESGCESSGRR